MRKIIGFIVFLIIIFVVNLFFYSISEDYRFFLKKLKDTNDVVYLDEKVITDKINPNTLSGAEIVEASNKNEEIFESIGDSSNMVMKEEVSLGQNYQLIIDLFSEYDLKKLELNSNLFDLTNEYPDNYFEYYSKDLVLYLFPTKTYKEIFDIFSVLDDELPFTINQSNSFGDSSFFINLNDDINDRFVRIVVANKGVVFGIKIKKTDYNIIKEKLNTLKTQTVESE